MAIQRLPAKADDTDIRAFQTRMTEVGRIRLGVFDPDKGNRGAPAKLDRFRLTSTDERLIRLAAEVYGGEAREYTPQRGSTPEWEVVTDVSELPVYVPRQVIEPWNEAWRPGTCIRRCDGVTEKIKNEPCVCNGDRPPADRDLCKPTVRVQLMLPEVPGLGTWRLEPHGANACQELSAPAPFIARTPVPLPAMLMLRKETRRPWNPDRNRFESLEFYVPWLNISAATPGQFAIGGDALTQALIAAGAPAALAPPNVRMVMALGAAPAAGATTPEQHPPVASRNAPPVEDARPAAKTSTAPAVEAPPVGEAHPQRAQILASIESKTTMEEMEALRDKIKARGVTDPVVRESWQSRYNALKLTQARATEARAVPSQGEHEASLRELAARQATPSGPESFSDALAEYDRAARQATDDQARMHGVDPFSDAEPVDAEVVDDETWAAHEAAGAPDMEVAGEYDTDTEFSLLFTEAGKLGWTTMDVHDRIKAFTGVKASQSTGAQLHALRESIKTAAR